MWSLRSELAGLVAAWLLSCRCPGRAWLLAENCDCLWPWLVPAGICSGHGVPVAVKAWEWSGRTDMFS